MTPTIDDTFFGSYRSIYDQFSGPIDKLKRQRKPDAKPKKPKPVTDEQLLAIVEELQAKIAQVSAENTKLALEIEAERKWHGGRLQEFREHVAANYKVRLFAPIKKIGYDPCRG